MEYNSYKLAIHFENATTAANATLYHRRDTLASRGKKIPDIDTIESCHNLEKIKFIKYDILDVL